MNYNSWDLGQLASGNVVRVVLEGNAANVRLLDSSNYRAFQSRREHRFVGGHYRSSPVHLQVPTVGHYYVVVDYGGYAGTGRASVQVLTSV
jgi:hypothetical protein